LHLLTYLFLGAAVLQLIIWIGIYLPLALYREPIRTENEENSVSIVIAARNEAENLQKYLDRILSWDFLPSNDNQAF